MMSASAMDTPDLNASLLDDAALLYGYAARAGRLPDGNRLGDAMRQVRQAAKPADADLQLLHEEIDKVVKAISPVTLIQLHRRASLIGRARHAVSHFMPALVGLMSLLLTVYLAFQSSQLHQANLALAEYRQWVGAQPGEKLYNAWKMYYYERVLMVKTPPLAQLDAYQRLVEDAKAIVSKGDAIVHLLQQSARLLYIPPMFERSGPDWLQHFAKSVNEAPSFDLSKLQGPGPEAASPPVLQTQACSERIGPHAADAMNDRVSLQRRVKQDASSQKPVTASHADLEAYIRSINCFLTSIGISPDHVNYQIWPTIYKTQEKVNLLVSWLLPGLYGILGACIYVLRVFMAGNGHQHPRDSSALHPLSQLLRIALGGLAGVIIGWFWVPTTVTGDPAAVPISSFPFAVAFIAGFSIETVFTLLNRFNELMLTKRDEADDSPKRPK